MQSRPRPMPVKPASDETRRNRLKLGNAALILKGLTGVKREGRTLRNWCVNGRKSYSGVVVKLKYEMILGVYYTTKADVREFLEELKK